MIMIMLMSSLFGEEGGSAGGCSTETAFTVGVDVTLTPLTPPETRADWSEVLLARMPPAKVLESVVAVERSAAAICTVMRTDAEMMVSVTELTGTPAAVANTERISKRVVES